jgi:hypothetical protein
VVRVLGQPHDQFTEALVVLFERREPLVRVLSDSDVLRRHVYIYVYGCKKHCDSEP